MIAKMTSSLAGPDGPYRENLGQGYLKDIICPLTEIGLMYLTKLMFSFIPFLVFGFWSLLATKVQKYKYHVIFVYILQGRMGKTENKRKENHATEVIKKTKNEKTKIWDEQNICVDKSHLYFTEKLTSFISGPASAHWDFCPKFLSN